MVKACDVDLQQSVGEGDETIATTEYNISEHTGTVV